MKLLAVLLALALPAMAGHAPQQLAAAHKITIGEGWCSGTAVGPHALLTAYHCDTNPPAKTMVVDATRTSISSRMKDGRDHEILIVGTTFKNIAELETQYALRPGDDVWICGNPDPFSMLVRRGIWAGTNYVDHPTVDIGPEHVMDVYDFNGFYGDSGAAVFDEHGRIVDVISVITWNDSYLRPQLKFVGAFGLRFTPEQWVAARHDK